MQNYSNTKDTKDIRTRSGNVNGRVSSNDFFCIFLFWYKILYDNVVNVYLSIKTNLYVINTSIFRYWQCFFFNSLQMLRNQLLQLLNDFVCHYAYFQFANKNRISIHVSLSYTAYNGTKDGQLQYANFSCNSYFVIHARNCSCQMYFGIVFEH